MYKNIGGKIKILAVVLCIIEAIAAICIAVPLLDRKYTFDAGMLILLAGPVIAWLSSCFIYGFGELIEKTSVIAMNTSRCGFSRNEYCSESEKTVKCCYCGQEQRADSRFCENCGKQIGM